MAESSPPAAKRGGVSYLPEEVLQRLRLCMREGAFREFRELLEALPPGASAEENAERRKLRGWLELALGRTEEAYRLFWSAPTDEGARFGILALTVLAGQVSTATAGWRQYCLKLGRPPLQLPDGDWHSRDVALGIISVLQNYPYPSGGAERGAAGLYLALLYRTIDDNSNAFLELSKVVDFYPLAELVREEWLEGTGCFPAPVGAEPVRARVPLPPPSQPPGSSESAVQAAARLLLYASPERLERQAHEALGEGRWSDALEFLRRLLTLDPEHTTGLEKRWRLHLRMGARENAQADLSDLVEIYEGRGRVLEAVEAAGNLVEQFGDQERVLLRMCFLQSRLANPVKLGQHGRLLLRLCQEQRLGDRFATYQRWLLRQQLSLDDRVEIASWACSPRQ